MRCAGCNRELEVGDRYIVDTSSGFAKQDANPDVDDLVAFVLGGSSGKVAWRRFMVTFDPAAAFLLDMQFPNLFEPASALPTNTSFRCKGCGEILHQQEREEHFRKHVRERDRTLAKRRDEIRTARLKALEKARAMRRAA